jgi:shikimate kinase
VFNGAVDQCSEYVDTFKIIKAFSTAGMQKFRAEEKRTLTAVQDEDFTMAQGFQCF